MNDREMILGANPCSENKCELSEEYVKSGVFWFLLRGYHIDKQMKASQERRSIRYRIIVLKIFYFILEVLSIRSGIDHSGRKRLRKQGHYVTTKISVNYV